MLGSVYRNTRCDQCDEVKPVIIGHGPMDGDGGCLDVLGFCLECMGFKDIEEYHTRLREQEQASRDGYEEYLHRQMMQAAEDQVEAEKRGEF